MRTTDIMIGNGAPHILKGENSEKKEKANLERSEELSKLLRFRIRERRQNSIS